MDGLRQILLVLASIFSFIIVPVSSIYYCYNPQLSRFTPPICLPATLEWYPSIRLCCGEQVVFGLDAVQVLEENPNERDLQLEIPLPAGCKHGFFRPELTDKRRLCPFGMKERVELKACCPRDTEPTFSLNDLQKVAVLKDQLIV